MRAVVQRVTSARVAVDGLIIGEIGLGLLVLLGAACSDDQDDVDYVVRKFLGLRIFQNSDGKMDLSVDEVDGAGGVGLEPGQADLSVDVGAGLCGEGDQLAGAWRAGRTH